MRAFILVRFRPDTDLSQVHHAVRQPGVKSVDLVMGPFDAIVTCEAADFDGLATVSKAVRGCPGIRDSVTCPVV